MSVETFEIVFPPEKLERMALEPRLLSPRQRDFLKRRNEKKCFSCGIKYAAQQLQIHHRLPVVMGGNDFIDPQDITKSNLVPLCITCHDNADQFIVKHGIIIPRIDIALVPQEWICDIEKYYWALYNLGRLSYQLVSLLPPGYLEANLIE